MARRIFFFILLMTPVLAVQLVKINRPFAGHFASYQLVMASMARNTLKENFSHLLEPKTDLLVNGQRSLHLNQYPFPSGVAALGMKIFKGTFEFWGRFQSIVCNLLSVILLGLIAALLWDKAAAWTAMALFAYSPYTIIYGQGFFSEPMSLLFLLLSCFLILKSPGWAGTLTSAFCFSIAVTGRIHWVLLFPVPALWIFFQPSPNKILRFLAFSAVAGAMPLAWYAYTYFAGLQSDHLLINVFLEMGMRHIGDQKYLMDPFFYKHLLITLGLKIITPVLLPFLVLGLFSQREPKKIFFLWAGILPALLVTLLSPQKVLAHDFYLYGNFPFICLAAAAGVSFSAKKFVLLRKIRVRLALGLVYLLISIRLFYRPLFWHEENFVSLAAAAKAVQENTRPEDAVIVASQGPAELVYYSDRPCWGLDLANIGLPMPGYLTNGKYTKVDPQDIARQEKAMKDPSAWLEYFHDKGASYVVTPNKKEIQNTPLLSYLEARYKKLSNETDDFYFFQLNS